jgi:hypothetical protein
MDGWSERERASERTNERTSSNEQVSEREEEKIMVEWMGREKKEKNPQIVKAIFILTWAMLNLKILLNLFEI